MSAYPTIPPPPRTPPLRTRPMQFAFFLVAIIWYFTAHVLAGSAARGIIVRFNLSDFDALCEALFLLFLIVVGVRLLSSIERRKAPLRITLGLPRRSTAREEWATGAALGWGLALISVVPIVLFGALRIHLWTSPRAWYLLVLSLLTLAIATLAQALAIHGYAFQRLIDAIGPVRATVLIAVLSGLYGILNPANFGTPVGTRICVDVLVGILFSLCWLRTHAVWLLWGLHFAWTAAVAILFGLPFGGLTNYSSVVETRAIGRPWLTGGTYGPSAAAFTLFVVLAGIIVLMRVTSDYAWKYTHPPLIPAGYDVTIAPPAAHLAMEAQQAAAPIHPASLVQILPMTSQSPTAARPSE